MTIPFSVLDLAPLPDSGSGAEAMRNTIRLARAVEEMGYSRFWIAEHHNFRGLAGVAPEVLISAVAQNTRTIRVGSGGVLVPNYAPLKVAELFRTLEGLTPGRIDAGLGRAPNMDPRTVLALRGSNGDPKAADDIARILLEVESFGQVIPTIYAADHPLYDVIASPEGVTFPPIFLLGSGQMSARIAAERGRGYAAAYFFSPDESASSIRACKESFVPSPHFARPHAILTVGVICAPTDTQAEDLGTLYTYTNLRRAKGLPIGAPSINEARSYQYNEEEWEKVRRMQPIVGSPATIVDKLNELVAQTGADELMITTSISNLDQRMISYELIADAFDVGNFRTAPVAHADQQPLYPI